MNQTNEPIAIIGMGCRFPGGGNNTEEFWQNLVSGKDSITEIPKDRWDIDRYYDPNSKKKGKSKAKWGGFLDKIAEFDAEFFGISPREASLLDPQQRLLLEVTYAAFEDAGLPVDSLAGKNIGVYIGAFTLDWKLLQFTESNRSMIDSHSATGSMMTLLSNRLSYAFDLKGPSLSVDTACSSSLVALHLACQSILQKESSMAVVGGVNVMLKPEYFIAESKAGMLSPDGRSKTYDSRANGYVRGEGAGVIVLKPLSKAIEDGDYIHSLIRASGSNQDGQTSSITVPSGQSQENLMRTIYEQNGISPSSIQYIEAHGTGTPVGDPIEAKAIGKVYSQGRLNGQKTLIGSVKTNIGHTEAAAGIAGVIKTVMSMKNNLIPKHLHMNKVNPDIDFEELGLKVPLENTPWPETNGPKRAAVNSFGFGGTNAHVLIEEYTTTQDNLYDDNQPEENNLIPLSAKSKQALYDFANQLKLSLPHSQTTLTSLGYTLSRRRDHHSHRLAILTDSISDLQNKLDIFLSETTNSRLHEGVVTNKSPLVFVFTGMGPQWWGMGHELYQKETIFRDTIDKIDEIFQDLSGWSLRDEMLKNETDSSMAQTKLSQPANFAVQVALCELWKSKGVLPDAIIGHSAGEAAAAFVSGALRLEDAVKVIYTRSRLQQLLTGKGRMLAVGMSEEAIENYIGMYKDVVSVAAINSPNSITLVGDEDALDKISKNLDNDKVFQKYLHVSVPYHSHYMEEIKEELLDSLQDIKTHKPVIPIYSTVDGNQCDESYFDAEYWWNNVRQPVRFAKGCMELIMREFRSFLEIGPHPVLASSINECLKQCGVDGETYSSLRRKEPEIEYVNNTFMQLYVNGSEINWDMLYPEQRYITKVPLYPWQKEYYWAETEKAKRDRLGNQEAHPILGERIGSINNVWRNQLNLNHVPFISDHKIQGTVVFPGAGYVDMALSSVAEIYGKNNVTFNVENIQFKKALFLTADQDVEMNFTYNDKNGEFQIFSQASGEENQSWDLNAAGVVLPVAASGEQIEIETLKSQITDTVSKQECYQHFQTLGLEYGEQFQGIELLWRNQNENESLAQIQIKPQLLEHVNEYTIHPAVLDLCFQVMAAALPFEQTPTVYMPVEIKKGKVYKSLTDQMWVYAKINEKSEGNLIGDIYLVNVQGEVILEINQCKAVSLKDVDHSPSVQQKLYELQWKESEWRQEEKKAAAGEGYWLIFADKGGVGHKIASSLEKEGEKVKLVQHSLENSQSSIVINPSAQDSYQELFETYDCKRIIHLWSLDLSNNQSLNRDALQEAERLSTNSVLLLLKALSENKSANKEGLLWLITRGAQKITDSDSEMNLSQSSLWGMAKVIGHQEFYHLFGGIIDLDINGTDDDSQNILNELSFGDMEDQIAYRKGKRFVARMEINQFSDSHTKSFPVHFNPSSTYLITGGLGSLGIVTAKWMISNGARHFILMGRTQLPNRQSWRDIDSNHLHYAKINSIIELERLGATIHVASVDIADKDQLTEYLDGFHKMGFPEVGGIIHSAGTAKPQLMKDMEVGEFNKVLRPKIWGAWNLHDYFDDKDLEFFIMYSSVASLVVSPGQSNYSAANAFLDALSNYRNSLGKRSVSVNWGPWKEVGMATKLDLNTFFIDRGLYPMNPQEGLECLEMILSQSKSQLAVLGADWNKIAMRNYPVEYTPMMVSSLIDTASNTKTMDSKQTESILAKIQSLQDESEKLNAIQEYLTDTVAAVLRMDKTKLNHSQSLTSWGLDSMISIELKNFIERDLHVEMAVVDLLKGINILDLSEHILAIISESDQLIDDVELSELLNEMESYSPAELESVLKEISASKEGEKMR
ncbi:type I polyketide synthase [Bacillus gobiensis]|uniref:type I polyketide synthase n=1 Tax=Bacillus gobiensis TaxID=1441095 RepID=UPI003D19AB16